MSPADGGSKEQLKLPVIPLRGRESWSIDGSRVVRTVRFQGKSRSSALPVASGHPQMTPAELWDWTWLRETTPPRLAKGDLFRVADLFSGCGQMTLGVAEAAKAAGHRCEMALAVDLDADALEVCRRTFPESRVQQTPIEELLPGAPGDATVRLEREFIKSLGRIDILVGGPPCQGHSDFNNHTRRVDDRNALALKMVRFAELTEPAHVILENVRGIVHDRGGVFQSVREHLERLGFRTAERLLKAERHGVAQTRWRMFLVASRQCYDVESSLDLPLEPHRPFSWACADLAKIRPSRPFDKASTASTRNQKRIDYLFDHGCWELPDSQRPDCHRSGGHSYKSIYGRLRWDQPAQTITTGFRCMGQGRFVHPKLRRTITAHEAARLQFIPDWVDFSGLGSTSVARLIGNAVPPKLAYGIALGLLTASIAR